MKQTLVACLFFSENALCFWEYTPLFIGCLNGGAIPTECLLHFSNNRPRTYMGDQGNHWSTDFRDYTDVLYLKRSFH
jgi:hypothetical protein